MRIPGDFHRDHSGVSLKRRPDRLALRGHPAIRIDNKCDITLHPGEGKADKILSFDPISSALITSV